MLRQQSEGQMEMKIYNGMEFDQEMSVNNYADTFFLCHVGKNRLCEKRVAEHTLVYMVSGEMEVFLPNGRIIHYKKGDTAFLRRNHRVNKEKHPNAKGEPFVGLFLHLNAEFLKRVKKEQHIAVPQHENLGITKQTVFNLPQHPFLDSLFQSLIGYFNSEIYPSKELMESKLREAVFVLLQLRPELLPVLFDFVEQWKIDIEDFMEENYKSDLTVEQFAHYTGRSLSSFKKDFDRIFHLTPQRWITRRRLLEAKRLMEESNKQPNEVYMEVGFKNLSHFSTAFKKEFGFPPSQLLIG